MSRSYRRYLARPWSSEKDDKRRANRRFRRACARAIRRNAEVFPIPREISDNWGWAKDGKAHYFIPGFGVPEWWLRAK